MNWGADFLSESVYMAHCSHGHTGCKVEGRHALWMTEQAGWQLPVDGGSQGVSPSQGWSHVSSGGGIQCINILYVTQHPSHWDWLVCSPSAADVRVLNTEQLAQYINEEENTSIMENRQVQGSLSLAEAATHVDHSFGTSLRMLLCSHCKRCQLDAEFLLWY